MSTRNPISLCTYMSTCIYVYTGPYLLSTCLYRPLSLVYMSRLTISLVCMSMLTPIFMFLGYEDPYPPVFMCMQTPIPLSICACGHLSPCLYVHADLYLPVYMSRVYRPLSSCLYVYTNPFLPVYMCIETPISLSICVYGPLSSCLYVYTDPYLPVYMCIRTPIFLSI